MNKIIRIFILVAIAGVSFTACKSKQKMTTVPGATIPAATTPTTTSSTVSSTTRPVQQPTPPQQEVTRQETFKLAAGETNNTALKKKFHVVVGAFTIHDNARNLRTKLTREGNDALTVENDKGMLRVIIASYNEYSQAKAKIDEIRATYSDAWVLVQK